MSCGAVFTGVIISLIAYLVMSVLGTAVGASLLSPLSQPTPGRAFGFGSGAWSIATTVVSVFGGHTSRGVVHPLSAGCTDCSRGP